MAEHPTVIPMMAYENGPAAMDWLARAFGFRERTRMLTKEGRLSHGEMEAGDGLIMMATPSPHYRGPKRHREECDDARKWSEVPYIVDGVLVYVEDVKAHFERATAAGATILSPVEEGPGGQRYRVEDVEGHRWMFVERR
ncbi:MAG: VOC family protein [Candidatus Dormibacter sp.]